LHKIHFDEYYVQTLCPKLEEWYSLSGIYRAIGVPEKSCSDLHIALKLGDEDAKRFLKECLNNPNKE